MTLSFIATPKARFIEHTGTASLWPIKQQHDTLMQCFANSVTLAGPVLLMATNQKSKGLHWLEIAGCVGWVCSFALENIADLQKISFVADAHKKGDLRTAVLGHAPYDGSRYWLWRMCRHPNYFGEVRARGRRRRCARLCAVEIMVVCNVVMFGGYSCVGRGWQTWQNSGVGGGDGRS